MIVQFKPRNSDMTDKDRIKMLCKGQIQGFTCDTCGEHFDVYKDNKPDRCPKCGLVINWAKSR